MRDLTSGLLAIAMLGFAGCTSSPPAESHDAADIVRDPFPEAQAAIRAEMLALSDIGRRHDWDGLRAAHLEGPKFSEIGAGLERNDFEEMITGEIAQVSAVQNLSIDWRELKIDVFGDVAVATSFPLYTGTDANGETGELELRATMVYVKTADGWKIAHEHLSPPAAE